MSPSLVFPAPGDAREHMHGRVLDQTEGVMALEHGRACRWWSGGEGMCICSALTVDRHAKRRRVWVTLHHSLLCVPTHVPTMHVYGQALLIGQRCQPTCESCACHSPGPKNCTQLPDACLPQDRDLAREPVNSRWCVGVTRLASLRTQD